MSRFPIHARWALTLFAGLALVTATRAQAPAPAAVATTAPPVVTPAGPLPPGAPLPPPLARSPVRPPPAPERVAGLTNAPGPLAPAAAVPPPAGPTPPPPPAALPPPAGFTPAVAGPVAAEPLPPSAAASTVDLNKLIDAEIRFQGTPISGVLEYYATLTKRSIIQAANLPQMTIFFVSKTRLTIGEAIQALDSVFAINGIAVVPLGDKFLKVVQMATAKQEAPPLHKEGDLLPASDTLLTQIIALQHIEVAEMVAALQPYMHAYGQLLPLSKSNSILITDTAANINQMQEIIRYVDRPSQMRIETKVYVIQNARAAEVVQQLQSIIQQAEQLGAQATAPGQPQPPRMPGVRRLTAGGAAGEGGGMVEGKVIITADERTNKIFLLGRPSNFEFFDKLVLELDTKIEPDVITRVVPLNYANAEEVAAQLNALITGGTVSIRPRTSTRRTGTGTGTALPPPPPIPAAPGGAGSGSAPAGMFEYPEGVRILPDPRTNSLLLMASRQDMERLEELIKSVDTSVAQVMIEVVIAEISLGNSLEVGVDTVKRMFKEGQVIQTGSTGAGVRGQPPADLSKLYPNTELLSGLGSNAAPLGLSSIGGLTYFLTFKNLKLDAVIRAMSTSTKFKVLSTPVIQTLHNQEASIVVGESRPFPTSTVSDINSANSTAVRSSIEFKDIAIDLRVTPRINPDGYVTMEIEQKINDVGKEVDIGGGVKVATILKREAKSSVAVKDQNTIMLGGLIREDKTDTETKVPFFGDIPFFGVLFKSKTTFKNRTELIIFIRPSVLRKDEDAVAEARKRSSWMKAGSELELERYFKNREAARTNAPAAGTPAPAEGPAAAPPSPPAAERPLDAETEPLPGADQPEGKTPP